MLDAQANLERVNAQLAQAQADYTRNKKLFDVQMMAASEFSPFESNLAQAKASLKSSQVTLDKAKQNLAFTNIYAPIDGVIVHRLVDVGQTVAPSVCARSCSSSRIHFLKCRFSPPSIIGVAVGLRGAAVLGHFTGRSTATPPLAIGVAVGFSAAVGVFLGFYPAHKAASLNRVQVFVTSSANVGTRNFWTRRDHCN